LKEPIHTIMDELIAKYLLQEATAMEIAQVDDWVAASDTNKKAFTHYKLLWEESKKIAATNTADENAAWQKFKNKLDAPRQETKVVSMQKYRWMSAAAAVLMLVLGGWFLRNGFKGTDASAPLLVATQKNVLIDTLPDNSVVTLNKNSSIEYDTKFTTGNQRNIKLKGEAFFSVTPNKEKPFIIKVNDVEVKVVGTSFNIKTINGQTEVIVKTGIVQVTRNGKTVTLSPQEKILTTADNNVLAKESTKDKLFNYYETKEFVCEETPLWRLVEVLNEAYDSNIIIGRKDLRNLSITTTFANEPLDNVLQIIATTFQLQIINKEGQIILQ
jgi:transmembrane sensor